MEKLIKWISGALLLLILVLASLITPIDFTPLGEQPFYNHTIDSLNTLPIRTYEPTGQLKVGWSQFSIVPDQPRPLAGYKPRDDFETVHDSLFVRILTIDNGAVTAYMISIDLLLFPPELKKMINEKLQPSTPSFIYLSASHTHTGVGGWDPTILGNILMGNYQEKWLEGVADNIIEHMERAKRSMKPSQLYHWEADASRHVINRIDKSGASPVDGMLRGISMIRSDSSKALLFTYSVHPTLISRKGTAVSADYPGAAISELHKKYQFAQFQAGMMGSHGIRGFDMYEFPLVDSIGRSVATSIMNAKQIADDSLVQIKTSRISVEQGPAQLRLTKHFKLRNWVFEAVINPLHGEIDILKIGDNLFLGTSCDFSGEIFVTKGLEKFAASHGTRLVITSFNGDYTGYITDDTHYLKSSHEEVRALNWVGPYFGEYYSQMIEKIIERTSE